MKIKINPRYNDARDAAYAIIIAAALVCFHVPFLGSIMHLGLAFFAVAAVCHIVYTIFLIDRDDPDALKTLRRKVFIDDDTNYTLMLLNLAAVVLVVIGGKFLLGIIMLVAIAGRLYLRHYEMETKKVMSGA